MAKRERTPQKMSEMRLLTGQLQHEITSNFAKKTRSNSIGVWLLERMTEAETEVVSMLEYA